MKQKLLFVGVGLAIAVAAVVVVLRLAGMPGTNTSNDKVQVGAALPLTGDSASWGEKARDGINLAFAQWRAKHGESAPFVELEFEDTAGNATGGSTAIRTLLSRHNPIAVIGGITSGATAAMAPLCQARKVVLLSPTASANALSNAGPYFFRLWPRDSFETEVFAKYLAEHGTKDVAVLYVQNEYGAGVKDVFVAAYPKVGGSIQTSQGYSPTETAFRPLLTKLKEQGIENIYIAGYYKDASLILTQAQDVGGGFRFFGTTTVGDPKILELAGGNANGLVFSELSSFDAEQPADDSSKHFMTSFKGRYNRVPGWAEAHAYDAAELVLAAIEAGARNGDSVREYLAQLQGFSGVTGKIQFDANGDIIGRRIAIKAIRDGKIIQLETVSR